MDFPTIVLEEGTVLYSGGGYISCLEKFIYIGQNKIKSDGNILYLTTSEKAANGYAKPHNKNSVIKKYIVNKNIILTDITVEKTFYEYDELQPFCVDGSVGYYLDWKDDRTDIEIALCNATEHLTYVGCKRHGSSEYKYECIPFCEKEESRGRTRRRRRRRRSKSSIKSKSRSTSRK
jgi:hypothetical protein